MDRRLFGTDRCGNRGIDRTPPNPDRPDRGTDKCRSVPGRIPVLTRPEAITVGDLGRSYGSQYGWVLHGPTVSGVSTHSFDIFMCLVGGSGEGGDWEGCMVFGQRRGTHFNNNFVIHWLTILRPKFLTLTRNQVVWKGDWVWDKMVSATSPNHRNDHEAETKEFLLLCSNYRNKPTEYNKLLGS